MALFGTGGLGSFGRSALLLLVGLLLLIYGVVLFQQLPDPTTIIPLIPT